MIFKRTFSTSTPYFGSYQINGDLVKIKDLLAIPAEDRSVAQWQPLLDWDLQRRKPYVVIDPLDASNLLYLTFSEYQSTCKLYVSNNIMPTLLAHPKSIRPVPVDNSDPSSSQNSPFGRRVGHWSKVDKLTWRSYLELNHQLRKVITYAKGTKMVSASMRSIDRTTYLWIRQCLHYVGVASAPKLVRLQHFVPYGEFVKKLMRDNGIAYLIKYLKVSLFCLYTAAAGSPLKCTNSLGIGIRLRAGLPVGWGISLRTWVKQGDVKVLRLMASVLNIYRALYAEHPKYDISTIIRPHPDFSNSETFKEFQKFCREVFPALVSELNGGSLPDFKYRSAFGLLLTKAGPNLSSPAMSSIVLDAQAWARRGNRNWAKAWFDLHQDIHLGELLDSLSREHHWHIDGLGNPLLAKRTPVGLLEPGWLSRSKDENPEPFPIPILGRLATINEPAGKVRVVAITDYWTQAGLSPVHDHLFKILRILSKNDATFDQDGVTESYFKREFSPHWSFDLKSATDLIPIALYREVLQPFFRVKGEDCSAAVKRVDLWIKMLTDRDWLTPDGDLVRYGTGQPMGALSSWASMALVHHAIVQFAHHRVSTTSGRAWFESYLVLGDDVDISLNQQVADSYKEVCSAFSIIIGLAKTLHSEMNAFEFANRRFVPDGDISPLSLKEELSSSNFTTKLEFAKRILRRYYPDAKNEEATLLRMVTTPGQWDQMIPEFWGTRPRFLITLMTFCLRNPFMRMEPQLGIRIDSLWDWLTMLLPTEVALGVKPMLESKALRVSIETRFVRMMRTSILDTLKRVLSDIPRTSEFSEFKIPKDEKDIGLTRLKYIDKNMVPLDPLMFPWFHPLDKEWKVRIGIDHKIPDRDIIQKLFSFGIDDFFLPGPPKSISDKGTKFLRVPAKAPLAYFYITWCILRRNVEIADKCFSLLRRVEFLASTYDRKEFVKAKMADVPDWIKKPPSPKYGEIDDNLFGQFAELWIETLSLPKPYRLDCVKGISFSLDYQGERSATPRDQFVKIGKIKLDPKSVQHVLFGPLKEIAVAWAHELGVKLPSVPYFNMKGQGRHWVRDINLALLRSGYSIGLPSSVLLRLQRINETFAERLYKTRSQ
jgi:hypothetical protein